MEINNLNNTGQKLLGVVPALAMLIVSYYVATRAASVGADTVNYIKAFQLQAQGYYDGRFEFLYVFLMEFLTIFSEDYRVFFFTTSMLLLACSYIVLNTLLDRELGSGQTLQAAKLMVLGLLFLSPFFFSLQVNIIRHGLAVSFILGTYLSVDKKQYFRALFCAIVSLGFHMSSALFLVVIPLLFLSPVMLTKVVAVLSVAYLSNLSLMILKPVMFALGLESIFIQITEYASFTDYRTGVRYDFWLFSAAVLVLAYFVFKYQQTTGALYRYLVVSFVPFLLFGYMAYSDRLLVVMWFIMPLVFVCVGWKFFMRINKEVFFVSANFLLFGSVIFLGYRLA